MRIAGPVLLSKTLKLWFKRNVAQGQNSVNRGTPTETTSPAEPATPLIPAALLAFSPALWRSGRNGQCSSRTVRAGRGERVDARLPAGAVMDVAAGLGGREAGELAGRRAPILRHRAAWSKARGS